jgi:hypothetical protein
MAFGVIETFFTQAAALFVANSAGYFLGGAIFNPAPGKIGMLLWRVIDGLCLGAVLGLSLFLAQTPRNRLDNLKPMSLNQHLQL